MDTKKVVALSFFFSVFVFANATAHLLSQHPEKNQCNCANVDGLWHYHYVQETSKLKSISKLEGYFDEEAGCKDTRDFRLQWRVFKCP